MSGLPRELLKWLQSLDLTYSVKNVKRDFSNGFLVAEIFSRYYVQDVEMHSFDNGTSLQRKLDNWGQLNKFFVKRGIKIEREIIDDVVHCKNAEAPTTLITQIYTMLTRREIRCTPAVDVANAGSDVTSVPPFARPNASSLLASNIKGSELVTSLQDRSAAQSRAKALLEEHSAALRQERTNDPSRFATTNTLNSSMYQSMLRGPSKPVSESLETATVRFQEVKVRPVDRQISQLRASRDPTNGGGGGSHAASAAAAAPVPASAPPCADVMQLLSEAVLAQPALLQGEAPPADSAFLTLVRALPDADEALAASFFHSAAANVGAMADACLQSPRQAWQLFNLLLQAMTAAAASASVSEAIASLLCAVGTRLVAADPKAAQSLLHDFGLPRLLPLLSQQPARRRELLSVLYAFCAPTPEAHMDTIRWLQESLPDQKEFLLTLSVLITLEPEFSGDLIDLYVYYCVIALGMPSTRLRSAALSMLPIVFEYDYALVLRLLPRLTMLAEEPWWEVSAGLGKICSLLLCITPGATSEEAPAVLELLLRVLASRNPMVLRHVLPDAAPLVGAQPGVGRAFAAALVEMPPAERAAVLQTTAGWPKLKVAQALLSLAKEQALDHLLGAHADVLLAVICTPLDAGKEAWAAWLKANKDYLYVGLCDEDLCQQMSTALLTLFRFLRELALPTFSTLFSSLRMLSGPDGHPMCQTSADTLLTGLYRMGEPFSGAVAKLVGEFEAPMRQAMGQTVKLVSGA